jgi:uncharacterized protein YjbI with pentapeptide repeats
MPQQEEFYDEEYFLSFPDPLLSRKLLKFADYPPEKKLSDKELAKLIAEKIYHYPTDKFPTYYQGGHSPAAFNQFIALPEGQRQITHIKEELKICFAQLKTWIRQAEITILDSDLTMHPAESTLDTFFTHLEEGFFAEKTLLFYADGKKNIETITSLVQDDAIDLTFRKNQIITLTMDNNLAHCADGCFSRFATSAQSLKDYGDFTPTGLIKKFIHKIAYETASKFSILNKNGYSYLENVCEAFGFSVAGNEVHGLNYLMTQLKSELELHFIHIAFDDYVQVFNSRYDENAEIRRNIQHNYFYYQDHIKKSLNVADLVSFIHEHYYAFGKANIDPAATTPLDDWISSVRGQLAQLGEDPDFSIHEILSFEHESPLALKQTGFFITIAERLLASQWLEQSIASGSRFYDKQQQMNLVFKKKLPWPTSPRSTDYRIFVGNFALSWLKMDAERFRMIDILGVPGGFDKLKALIPANQMQTLLENAHDLYLFFKHLSPLEQSKGLEWLNNSPLDLARVMLSKSYPEDAKPTYDDFTAIKWNILESFNKIFSTLTEDVLAQFISRLQETDPLIISETLALAIKLVVWRADPSFEFIHSISVFIKLIMKGKFENFANFEFEGENLKYLHGIDFSNADLRNTKFKTIVSQCDFSGALLEAAKFTGKIENSKFHDTDLRKIKFRSEYSSIGSNDNLISFPFQGAKFSTQSFNDFLMFNRPETHSIEMGFIVFCMKLLKRADLREVDFKDRHLKTNLKRYLFLNFSGANLQLANLNEFNRGVERLFSFKGANLKRASFKNANLQSIDFAGADLSECDLATANLQDANLQGAKIENTFINIKQLFQFYEQGHRDFASIRLAGRIKTHLKQRSLQEAKLSRQAFLHLYRQGFHNFHNTNLQGVLKGLLFKNTNLKNIDFTEADLSDCDLSIVDITLSNLRGAKIMNSRMELNQLFQLYEQGHRDFTSVRLIGKLKEQFKQHTLVDAQLSEQGFSHLLRRGFRNFQGADLSQVAEETLKIYANQEDLTAERKKSEIFKKEQGQEKHECLFFKKKRSINECLFGWADVDEFNEEKKENRNIAKIKINSRQFIHALEHASEPKRAQLLRFAKKKTILGPRQAKIKQLIQYETIRYHLNKVSRIANGINQGFIAKNILADLIQGAYEDVAINLSFLMGGQAFGRLSEKAKIKAAEFLVEDRKLLASTLQFAAPFLARGTSVFLAYDLVLEIRALKQGNRDALASLVGDSVYLGVDTAEIGIEVAEMVGLFDGIAALTGPVGMVIGTMVFVVTNLYQVVKQVKRIDAIIPLTLEEKFIESVRALINLAPERAIAELIETKQLNTQLVKQSLTYLKQHPALQRHVFPSGKLEEGNHSVAADPNIICILEELFIGRCIKPDGFGKSKPVKKFRVDLDNRIILNKKHFNITWSFTKPHVPEDGELFCFASGQGEIAPASYFCQNAIGVADLTAKTGNYTFIDVGEGEDIVVGFVDSPNIISASNGLKHLEGGQRDDLFILQGNVIRGDLQGGPGNNTLEVSNFALEREVLYMNLAAGSLSHNAYHNASLRIANIQRVVARNKKADIIDCACDTLYVDSRGGANETSPDRLHVPSERCVDQALQFIISPATVVDNQAVHGNFSYFISQGGGLTQIALNGGGRHQLFFNYSLAELKQLHTAEINSQTGQLKTSFYLTASLIGNITLEETVDVTQHGHDHVNYILNDGTEIKRAKQQFYVMHKSQGQVDEILRIFPDIANKLNAFVVVHLANTDETIMIGHGRHEIIPSDPAAHKSHLVGNAGENIYVINPPKNSAEFSEVLLYRVHAELTIDTLDLRPVVRWMQNITHSKPDLLLEANDKDLCLILHTSPQAARKQQLSSSMKIILKNACWTDWYKRLHVIRDQAVLRIVRRSHMQWGILPEPLRIDGNKKIIFISAADVEANTQIRIPQPMGSLFYARDGEQEADLVITNADYSRAADFCTLILKRFYQEPHLQTLSIRFTDQTVLLKNELPRIKQAPSLKTRMNQTAVDMQHRIFGRSPLSVQNSRTKRKRDVKYYFPAVTNTASALSSWLATGLQWIGQWLDYRPAPQVTLAAPTETRSYSPAMRSTAAIEEKMANPRANTKTVHGKSSVEILEIGDQCVANLNKQGLLQLLDLAARKWTGKKYHFCTRTFSLSQEESLAQAGEIRSQVEHAVKWSASKAGLSYTTVEARMNFPVLEKKLAKAFYQNPHTDIHSLLTEYINELFLPFACKQKKQFQNNLLKQIKQNIKIIGDGHDTMNIALINQSRFFVSKAQSQNQSPLTHEKRVLPHVA